MVLDGFGGLDASPAAAASNPCAFGEPGRKAGRGDPALQPACGIHEAGPPGRNVLNRVGLNQLGRWDIPTNLWEKLKGLGMFYLPSMSIYDGICLLTVSDVSPLFPHRTSFLSVSRTT